MSGRRHSQTDQDHINGIVENAIALGADHPRIMPDSMLMPPIKAEDVEIQEPVSIWGYVKAAGDWELDVLANPFGGPNGGRDADGETFTPSTKFHEDKIPLPPVVYYHGYGDDKRPTGEPEWIGRTVKRWVDERGVWYRVALDKTSKFAERVWDAAKRGVARASTGVVLATHRVNKLTGEITSWLNGELSIFETDSGKKPANGYAVALPTLKAVYAKAQLLFPEVSDTEPETEATGANSAAVLEASVKTIHPISSQRGDFDMTEQELTALLDKREAERNAQAEVEAKRKADEDARVQAAVKAALDLQEQNAAKSRRLPVGEKNIYQSKFGQTRRFDNLDPADNALLIEIGNAMKSSGRGTGPSEAAYQSLAHKLENDRSEVYESARGEMKAVGLKANELNHSTQAGFGDEWVGVAYSTRLWEAVRAGTFIGERLMRTAIEIPQGLESITLPLESTDPTFYKVAQTTATNATTGIPDASVSTSKVATGSKSLTLAKMGARVVWSGEMEEDSLIPFIANLRRQLEIGAAEQFETAIIDGDTATGATTNVNDIAGTPAGTEVFLLVDGPRKLALVTNTANSRSNGALTAESFLETVKLMGLAGKNAYNKANTEFILDPHTAWKALTLAEVKTRDVFSSPTIENGLLTSIYGYKVNTSYFMHYANQDATYGYKANTAGKLDLDTASNNTTGSILAVRFDQWQLGLRRRVTLETQRIPQADATQIVSFMRFGLAYRDTEAAAISYNVSLA